MLDAAERLLAASKGRRLILSDVAAEVGMSQSYAHRFFPRKADLVRALALRWFAEVEAEADRIVAADLPAQGALRAYILTILKLKRDRFDADPALFRAYLTLAQDHMDIVQIHTAHLSDGLRSILARLVPAHAVDAALALVEDATARFRIPMMIAAQRHLATDARAEAVLEMLCAQLGAGAPNH